MGTNSSKSFFTELKSLLSTPQNDKDLFETIVNAPFKNKLHTTTIDLGIIVLLLVNKKTKTIDRIALSKTEHAEWAIKMSPVPFHEIKIPVNNKQNTIAKAIKTGVPQKTTDWKYLFVPALAPEAARFNQAGAGIACSFVYPLIGVRDGGAMIFSYYQPLDHITKKHTSFMDKYALLVADALR